MIGEDREELLIQTIQDQWGVDITPEALPPSGVEGKPGGVWWLEAPGTLLKNALALFFRPTGITHDDRPEVIQKLDHMGHGKSFLRRFDLVVRAHGPGAGGLEIFAYQREEKPKNQPRLSMLIEGTWGPLVYWGEEIGSVGWLPREFTKLYRTLLYEKYPYAVTNYAIQANYGSIPSICLCLVVWNLEAEKKSLAYEVADIYPLVEKRTNLKRWTDMRFKDAWLPDPRQSDSEINQLIRRRG